MVDRATVTLARVDHDAAGTYGVFDLAMRVSRLVDPLMMTWAVRGEYVVRASDSKMMSVRMDGPLQFGPGLDMRRRGATVKQLGEMHVATRTLP